MVFESTGRFLGELRLPYGFRPMEITDERVIGVWTDSLGVEFVEVYTLRKQARSDPSPDCNSSSASTTNTEISDEPTVPAPGRSTMRQVGLRSLIAGAGRVRRHAADAMYEACAKDQVRDGTAFCSAFPSGSPVAGPRGLPGSSGRIRRA